MRENKLRYMLENNMPTVGTRLQSSWPMVTEIAGATGEYDYIEFLAEYAPYDQYDMENIARAAEVHNMGTMIKVDYQNRYYVAQKAIASGFQAVLFTDHRTAEDVEKTIHMITPECPQLGGHMGFVNRRWVGNHCSMKQEEYADMASKTVKVFMIEKKEAVDNIDEICSVPGIDMIQFGPNDFALSSGFNMAENMDRVREAERKVFETALKHGIQPRAEMNSAADMEYYLGLGVRHFNMGMELRILSNFWKEQGSLVNEAIKKAGLK
ncbi:aldolase/citrate lyase family protein [Lachnospiraceae bacterium 62-35]